MTEQLPVLENISLDRWDHKVFQEKELQVDVLRLDKIHPEISGNKWFKLKYHLLRAKQENIKKLVSFGGAYSNHLIALAEACRLYGFSSSAFIRGEEPVNLSHTLKALQERGMELRFLSRGDYQEMKRFALSEAGKNAESHTLVIPEGGGGNEGILGAEEILSRIPYLLYSHICSAVGTGTTMAGIINSAGPLQKIIGVSVLRGTINMEPIQTSWLKNPLSIQQVRMIHEYHFGGYAKYSKSLLYFMNLVYAESGIPTDFVYTGKLFYSIVRLATRDYFPSGSRILVLHTGGLQGNHSLTPGLMRF